MDAFDYNAQAELFPTVSKRPRRMPFAYQRFDRAADAIRFAIEVLPPPSLVGAWLEVDEQRFDAKGIRDLYDNAEYPLAHAAAPASDAPEVGDQADDR
jgi:hypothetical protein